MNIRQKKYTLSEGWETELECTVALSDYQLVLVFGNMALLSKASVYANVRNEYPSAAIIFSSGSGSITNTSVNEDSISVTAINFTKASINTAAVNLSEVKSDYEAGCKLASGIKKDGLKYILVLSDGQLVNGSELVKGLQENFSDNILITGGLAGGNELSGQAIVGLNEVPYPGRIVLVAFYGDIILNYGSVCGGTPFGPERLITKSEKNVLYELDGKPALDIYKLYLGDEANHLPASAYLFPICIGPVSSVNTVVRSVQSINEAEKSLRFVGNIPRGYYARFVQIQSNKLVEGATEAAKNASGNSTPELAILISCIGRKLVLSQRVEEEVEAVKAVLGSNVVLTGFYSNGEICPLLNTSKSELHNQTMTITTLSEK